MTVLAHRPRLILLASPLIMSRSYSELKTCLSGLFQVEVIELPASGKRSFALSAWSDEEYAGWLKDFLERRGLSKVYVLGHSNSGAIAMKMALLDPDRVQGLILADTTGVRPVGWIRTILGRGLDALIELKLTLWALFHLLWSAFLHPFNFAGQLRYCIKGDLSKLIPKIRVPTMIVWGERDHTMPLAHGERLHRMVKDSRLYVFKEGSHDFLLTHPREFTRAVQNWLGGA